MPEIRRQRSIMATESDWNRVKKRADAAGLSISQFLLRRALEPPQELPSDSVPEAFLLRRIAMDVAALSLAESWRMGPSNTEAWQRILQEAERRVDSERILS